MKTYKIQVIGCDATTTFSMQLSPEEFVLVERLCALCTETSTYGCEPVMYIKEVEA